MYTLVLGSLWGLVILVAVGGWGWCLLRWLDEANADEPAIFLPLGFSLSIAVGGVFNLVGLVSSGIDIAFLSIGLLLATSRLWFRKGALLSQLGVLRGVFASPTRPLLWKLCVVLLVGLACLVYVGSVYSVAFSPHDDVQGYFLFPLKMLQTGSLGLDPFSERRLIASLGGQYFLHTFVLSVLPVESLHLIDSGISFVAMLVMVGSTRNDSLFRGSRLLVAFATVVLAAVPRSNVTSAMSAVVVLFGLYRWLDIMQSRARTSDGVVLGMLISGAIVLKSTYIVPVAATAGTFLLVRLVAASERSLRRMVTPIVVVVLTALLAGPWMYSMYKSSGTLLYPLLGRGYHGSVTNNFTTKYSSIFAHELMVIMVKAVSNAVFVSFGCLSYLTLTQKPRDVATVATIVGGISGVLALGIAAGFSLDRYMFPFVFPAVLFLVYKTPDAAIIGNRALVPLLVCVWFMGAHWRDARLGFVQSTANIRSALIGQTLASAAEIQSVRSAQRSVPVGETILEHVTKPFLLDFRRNHVLINDCPGGASPFPGMPYRQGPEPLSKYLIDKSIRYVMYSYRDEALFTHEAFGSRLSNREHPWLRSEAERVFDFHDSLSLLGNSRLKSYEDQDLFVLKLTKRIQ